MSILTLCYCVEVNTYIHTVHKARILNSFSFLHVCFYVQIFPFLEGEQLYWLKAYPKGLILIWLSSKTLFPKSHPKILRLWLWHFFREHNSANDTVVLVEFQETLKKNVYFLIHHLRSEVYPLLSWLWHTAHFLSLYFVSKVLRI